jgi:NAD(P)-dependent dehydrogenase (short-subunit alcohol dehydrogenase family)
MDFDGRNVVVTGGTGALGVAVVTALIEAGAVCHIPYRHDAEADRSGLRDQARVKLYAGLELSDGEAVERLFTGLPTLWASIHLAGGFAFGALKVIDEATLRQQIESNFVTCALCCRAALRTFARGGSGGSASEGGRIVNVAARPALEWRTGAHMAASKAAVAALTMALAEEVAKEGILVNAVAPSIMDTQSNRKAMPKADFSTWPKVEEVAQTILFLASPANAVTRGAIVPVYGRA